MEFVKAEIASDSLTIVEKAICFIDLEFFNEQFFF